MVQVIVPIPLATDVQRILSGAQVQNGRPVVDGQGRMVYRAALVCGGLGGDWIKRDGVELHRWVVVPAVGIGDIARALPAGCSVEPYMGDE